MEVSGYVQIGKAHAETLASLTRHRKGLRYRITRLHEFDDGRASVITPAVPGHARHPTTMPFRYYYSYGRDWMTVQGL